MELWDAYDAHLNVIGGQVLVRGKKIPKGVYHLVSEVIVRHQDGTYLLTQRDSRKNLGGMWEATAGGSALQGESPLECAKRELREETGIVTGDFVEVGRVLHQRHQTYYVNYQCITDVDKASIVLQEGETSAYKWVTAEELRQMSREELATQRIQNFIEELS
ncbi:putative Nudix hydrolase [Streptococcus infantarius subsp. infantarius]|nr:putative Nudix hydrolase [Streptococcus infantarius subsp. infantarius]MCO4476441.1 putative Nudix hydrolase [Streptococcus infantarius subsp. infantarius]MCO4489091.1 putative Nudix hydrolase [Streptococcus infantarius subsp. infantarius]MCO4490987.1 putative Nudix hydrolase [Streptococcus infantarius subsp. infantarius]MCO4492074.1 putative Nudix hydrolase [Streptococcus infantarius subsp. infantarius]